MLHWCTCILFDALVFLDRGVCKCFLDDWSDRTKWFDVKLLVDVHGSNRTKEMKNSGYSGSGQSGNVWTTFAVSCCIWGFPKNCLPLKPIWSLAGHGGGPHWNTRTKVKPSETALLLDTNGKVVFQSIQSSKREWVHWCQDSHCSSLFLL